mmetsp:Transcript_47038/g.121513  ORF Transcript_47038/g.121513 Transcript_47038/m.121513 type:complete len:80 (-) Transcript_47038:52-291(-)
MPSAILSIAVPFILEREKGERICRASATVQQTSTEVSSHYNTAGLLRSLNMLHHLTNLMASQILEIQLHRYMLCSFYSF